MMRSTKVEFPDQRVGHHIQHHYNHQLIIPGLPIIGNLLDIDVTNSLQSIIDMAKGYRTSPTATIPDYNRSTTLRTRCWGKHRSHDLQPRTLGRTIRRNTIPQTCRRRRRKATASRWRWPLLGAA
jgi:hypothetical protein